MPKKKLNKKKLRKEGSGAQTAPVVLIMTAVLTIFATALLGLFRYDTQRMGMRACVADKEELAQVAIEHALFKLQSGSNWDSIPANFIAYTNEFTTSFGHYTMHVTKGNLFMTGLSAPYPVRQGEVNFRTIGIKVKTNSGCTGAYYAVVKKVGFGGPIVSRGFINLPCDSGTVENFEPYWGDVYSANPTNGKCRIPKVPVGNGNYHPQDWKPQVYSKADIYTAYDSSSTSRGGTVYFGTTYVDMSPTANCHPYSPYAEAPDIDFDYYKALARRNPKVGINGVAGAYYGPATVGGAANPYYIDAFHEPNDIVNANIAVLKNQVQSIDPPDVLYIDTTDGLPLNATGTNSYCGRLNVTTDNGSDNTLRWYGDIDSYDPAVVDASPGHQIFTKGLIFVQGPFLLMGDDPDNDGDLTPESTDLASVITGTPDNFYFPRRESNEHFYYVAGNTATSYLADIKHQGLIYCGGELRLGAGATSRTGSTLSNIGIYGTLYIGELGTLSGWAANTDAQSHIYYNPAVNVFGFSGSRVQLVTFNEITFLIPTPEPNYPASF